MPGLGIVYRILGEEKIIIEGMITKIVNDLVLWYPSKYGFSYCRVANQS